MSKKKEETPVTENTGVLEKEEPKFTIEELKDRSFSLFGVSSSTYVGATSGLKGKYTVRELKSIISGWLKKEVK